MITLEMLHAAAPNCRDPEMWLDIFNAVLPEYGIDSDERIAAFLSQTAHESMDYNVLRENLNYSPQGLLKTFPKYFDASTANVYGRNAARIANRVYANRMGNGPEQSGDGWRFKGRGILQVTGKKNYAECSDYIFGDPSVLLDAPEKLEEPEFAVRSACWYWSKNNLNDIADTVDLKLLTRRINGGLNGFEDRVSRYNSVIDNLA